MATLYKVIYTGKLKSGADLEHFVKMFSKQFGVSEAQALKLAGSGKDVAIKKNAKLDRAKEYQSALESMGMNIRLESMEGERLDETSATPSSPPTPPESTPPLIPLTKASSEPNPYAAPAADLYDKVEEGSMTGPVKVPAAHGLRWITRGFWHFRQNMGAWLGSILLWMIISVVLSLIPLIGQLAMMLLSPVLSAGFMIGADAQHKGDNFTVGHLFAGFSNNTGQLMLVGVMYLVGMIVIIGVGMLLLGGVVATLFTTGPGFQEGTVETAVTGTVMLVSLLMMGMIMPLLMAYWFAAVLVALEGMSAIAAMRSSFFGCLKNMLPFLLFSLVAMVLMVVAAIPLLLGFLVLIPVIIASTYVAYRDIYHGPTEFG